MTSDSISANVGKVQVRSIDWRDVCPWALLFQVPRVACNSSIITLGLLGLWSSVVVWSLLCSILVRSDYGNVGFQAMCQRESSVLPSVPAERGTLGDDPVSIIGPRLVGDRNPLVYAARRIAAPFWMLVHDRAQLPWAGVLLCIVGGAANILIWGLFGTAICRIAAADLGSEQRVGFWEALAFSRQCLGESYLSTLVPILGVLLLTLPLLILGWAMRLNLGVFLAGLLWIPCLAISLVSAVLVLGFLLGWPLLWAGMAAEGKDAFDAVSRSYSYAFQRPLNYGLYVLLVAILGALSWALVLACGDLIILMANWSTGWGAGEARMQAIQQLARGDQETGSMLARIGAGFMQIGNGLVAAGTHAFAYGFFWTAVTGIYLLLRRDIDQKEVDEIAWTEQRVVPPWEQTTEISPTVAATPDEPPATTESTQPDRSAPPHTANDRSEERLDGGTNDGTT